MDRKTGCRDNELLGKMLSDGEPCYKAVSKLMGHAKELITVDVYGDNSNITPEEIPELQAYMDEVLPDRSAQQRVVNDVSDIIVDMRMHLPETKSG